jgi:hypothetical protein
MIAEHLRFHARWRINRAEEGDEGRNARSAVALLDAATYLEGLDDGHRMITRLTRAGCFAGGSFDPGVEGERIIRFWHYDDPEGAPAELLETLVAAVERGLVPRPRTEGPRGIPS